MPVESLSSLRPEARALAEKYISDVDAAMRPSDPDGADATAEDLRAHLCDVLGADSTAADVAALIDELGAPSSFAEYDHESDDPDGDVKPAGRVLGIPYDYRLTPAHLASRWWNPRDPRVLMPRVFGLGWDLNFGAVAVKLHLIEPDAEDEPFATVSDRAFLVALLVPVALTAFLIGTFLGTRLVLPASLPTHWNAAGTPDGYWTQGAAFGFLLAVAILPTAWALWSVATRRPPLSRGAVIGFASFTSALAAGIWVLTLATVLAPPVSSAMPPLAILPGLLVPLAVFVGLARAGRLAEQRRDLQPTSER